MPRRRHPGKRGPRRSGIPSVIASTRTVDKAAARAAAAAQHERRTGAVLKLHLDRCKLNFGTTNEFGTCTATGIPCYQTFPSCKDKPNYKKGTFTRRYCTEGMKLPPGEPMRPYIQGGVSIAPSEIDMAKGLAIRSRTSITVKDEPDSDVEDDPYALTTRGGYALDFELDSSQSVSLPDVPLWDFGAVDFVFECRARAESFPGLNTLYEHGLYTAGFLVRHDSAGSLALYVNGAGAGQFATWTCAPTLGVKYHLIVQRRGADAEAYMDGVLLARTNNLNSASAIAIAQGPSIAKSNHAAQFYDGVVDAVRLYSGRSFTAQEAAQRAAGTYLDETGLVGRWEFNEGTGIVAADSSGNGNNGTLINGPTWVPGLAPIPTPQGTYWTRLLARNKNYGGRFAELDRGFITEPFSWDTFLTEHYIIESIKGPDSQGRFKVELSDTIRLLDHVQIPPATDGKLAADLPAVSNAGTAQAGGATSITLAAAASAVDDFYKNQEVFILENTGAGQRKKAVDYVGATRVLTVDSAWAVNPNATSVYEVVPLQLTLDAGKGVKYPDPAGTGGREEVKIGDEVLAYTARNGDVLSWPDGTYRAQGDTVREEHKKDAGVQIVQAWIDQPPATVVRDITKKGMLPQEFVDVPGLEAEVADWLPVGVLITARITAPEKASELLKDLLIDLNMFTWWDPVAKLTRFKSNMPAIASSIGALTDDELGLKATQVEPMDAERLTRASIHYGPRSATVNLKEAKNFGRQAEFRDGLAESPDEYGDVREEVRYSRWFTAGNDTFAQARVARLVGRRRDAPLKVRFQLDPRNEVELGQLKDLTSRAIVDVAGAPKVTRVRITKKQDMLSHLVLEARTTNLGRRYGFIAPAGFPNYDAATEAQRVYAFIADNDGLMSDGTEAYVIS